MKIHFVRFVFLMLVCQLGGCALSIDGQKYASQQPPLDLFAFFDGEVKAWGIVQDRQGEMVQQFTVDIVGQVNQGQLTLDETFYYLLGDGIEKRVWRIRPSGSGKFVGAAGDVDGPASGEVFGNAMRWSYSMDLPVGDTSYSVTFEDWLWAFDGDTLVNRAYIKKFGVVMAEVTLFMQKAPSAVG